MAINYETILSSYDDRLTLLEFMNRVLDALENASVDASHFTSLGNGQYTFSIDFADGSTVESAPVTINGAKGVSSFSASNGVLSIGLTDGSTLSANPMNGDISISGSLDVSGPVSVRDQSGIDVDGPISASGNASVSGDISVANANIVTDYDHNIVEVKIAADFKDEVYMNSLVEIETDQGVNLLSGTSLNVDGDLNVVGDATVSGSVELQDELSVAGAIYTDSIEPYQNATTSITYGTYNAIAFTCDAATAYPLGRFLNVYLRGVVTLQSGFSGDEVAVINLPAAIWNSLSSTYKYMLNKDVVFYGRIPVVNIQDQEDTATAVIMIYKDSGNTLKVYITKFGSDMSENVNYFMSFNAEIVFKIFVDWDE